MDEREKDEEEPGPEPGAGRTHVHGYQRVGRQVQRLQADKVGQGGSQESDLLLKRPRETQRADITCMTSKARLMWLAPLASMSSAAIRSGYRLKLIG